MIKKPLVFIAIFFIFGIIFGFYANIPVWILLPAIFLFAAGAYVFLNNERIFFLSVLSAFFLMGAFVFNFSSLMPKNHIKNYTPTSGLNVVLSARVVSEPVYKKNKTVFIVESEYLKLLDSTVKVRGKVLVWCFKETQIKRYDYLIAQGKLYQPYPLYSGKKFNYRDYLKQRDIYSQLSISGKSGCVYNNNAQKNVIVRGLQRIKKRIRHIIDENLSVSSAGLIRAMILGDRSMVPNFVNESLQRSGTVHVLAVSGLHTGIIIIIALLFFKLFSMHYRLRYVFVLIILGFYCWFTGGRISVLRASIMGGVFLFGEILNRDYDPLNALSLSALIILMCNPSELFNVGFQLSFCSVLSIFLISLSLLKRIPQEYKNVSICRYFIQGACISIGAWIGTAGIVAYYFNIFTPISVLANLIIIPVLFLIILSALLFIIIGLIFPGAAPILALNCEFFTVLLYKINSLLISVPGAYIELADIPLAWVFLYYIIIVIVCFLIKPKSIVRT